MTNVQRRADIITAAEKIFARKGFHAATMDEIAQTLDLAKGTLYLYFKSKDDLLFSILEQRMVEHNENLESSLSQATTLFEAIEILVSEQINFLKKHHHFFKLNLVEQCRVDVNEGNQFRIPIMEKHKDMMNRLIIQINRLMPQKDDFKARSLILTITGACHAHLLDMMITGDSTTLENGKKEILEFVLPNVLSLNGDRAK